MNFSGLKVTYSGPKVTYGDHSDPKVTHIDPTHLPLPLPASPGHHHAIRQVYWDFRVVVVVAGGNQL